MAINGDAHKFDFREDDDDYYSQPGILFRMFSQEEKQRLFENTARSLGPASKEVRDRHVVNCTKADPAYGEGVAKALEEYLQSARNPMSLSTVS
ncbi:MAG: catalase-related domain-containing protein [Terracidiphilus sp.]